MENHIKIRFIQILRLDHGLEIRSLARKTIRRSEIPLRRFGFRQIEDFVLINGGSELIKREFRR